MNYKTLLTDYQDDTLTITLNRPDNNNALNFVLMNELQEAIESTNEMIKIIVVQGQNGVFSTGMDLQLFSDEKDGFTDHNAQKFSSHYMHLLTTFATINKVIVAKLDGKVMAGGIGLVAAADLVFASPQTTFCLSEALWGLLPANVMPFLIRRVGFQTAYRMTLTTETVSADFAKECHLVDEILPNLDEELVLKLKRVKRLQSETITDLKSYFNQMNLITGEQKQLAVNTLTSLIGKPRVQKNINDFVQQGKLPWS